MLTRDIKVMFSKLKIEICVPTCVRIVAGIKESIYNQSFL